MAERRGHRRPAFRRGRRGQCLALAVAFTALGFAGLLGGTAEAHLRTSGRPEEAGNPAAAEEGLHSHPHHQQHGGHNDNPLSPPASLAGLVPLRAPGGNDRGRVDNTDAGAGADDGDDAAAESSFIELGESPIPDNGEPPAVTTYKMPPTLKPPEDDNAEKGAAIPLPDMPPKLFPVRYVADQFPSDPPAHRRSGRPRALKLAPPGRWLHTATVFDLDMVVYGGVAKASTMLNDVWVYQPDDQQWFMMEPPTIPSLPISPNPHTLTSTSLGRPPQIPPPPEMKLPPGVKTIKKEKAASEGVPFRPLKVFHIPPVPADDPVIPVAEPVKPPDQNEDEQEERRRRRPLRRLLSMSAMRSTKRRTARRRAMVARRQGQHVYQHQHQHRQQQQQQQQTMTTGTFVETGSRAGRLGARRAGVGVLAGAMAGAGDPPVATQRERMAHPRMLSDVWIYSIAKREWRQPTPVTVQPVPRWMHTSVAFQDKMWIFGGCTNNMMLLNDVWVYHIKINQWAQIPPALDMPPPLPREGHTMIEDGTVFGGISYGYKPFNDVWLFDFKTGLWHRPRPKGPVPPARWLHTANLVNETMVVFGGCGERFTALNDVWLYSKGFWAEVRPQGWPPQARWLHTALLLRSTYGDLLKVFGGAANNAPLEDMWTFNMTDGSWEESHDPLQIPMAREGHTMVLLEPPEVVAEDRRRRRRRRRLLASHRSGLASEESKQESMVPALERDNTIWVNGPDEIKKPEPRVEEKFPEWFCVFGGVGERGLVASSQNGEGIFAR